MIKTNKFINTFSGGIDVDTSVTKIDNTHYLDVENMRIISNDSSSSGALTSVNGNTLRLTFESGDVILGFCKIRSNVDTDKDAIVFFVHNGLGGTTSRIYLFDGDPFLVGENVDMTGALASHTYVATGYVYESGVIYANSGLNFNPSYPIKAEGRYESAEIRKVYWVDGYNNIKYMILDTVTSGDAVTVFDINPTAVLSEPSAIVIPGGSYTSGLVQYSYQLYIKNGASTTYSPLSELLYLTTYDGGLDSKTFGGSKLGDNTGKATQITISGLDPNYNRIRIVAVHYTESLVNPTVSIVGEIGYTGTTLTFIDNGYTVYGTVPIEEFRLLGQTNYIANSLASEYNYLFFADITEDKWNPDWLDPTEVTFWDSRAIRFRSDEIMSDGVGTIGIETDTLEDLDVGVTMLKGGDDSTIDVSIDDFSTFIGIPGDRTLIDVTSVISMAAGTIVDGDYTTAGPTVPFSSTAAETTTSGETFVGGTFQFSIHTSGAPYFGVGYTGIDNCTITGLEYSYTYSYTLTYDDSVVDDTISGSLTIDKPTDRTDPADWITEGFDHSTTFPITHDAINIFNDINNDGDLTDEFKYQADCATLGAEGPNIVVEFETEDLEIDNNVALGYATIDYPYTNSPALSTHRSSQRTEVYRMYIVFFNTKMQHSNPQWICDLRMPSSNDTGFQTIVADGTSRDARYIYPKVTIRNVPADANLYAWQIFRCERNSTDRGVVATGLISTCMKETFTLGTVFTDLVRPYSNPLALPYALIRAEDGALPSADKIIEVISPEILFNKNLKYSTGDKLRVDGRYTPASAPFSTNVDGGSGNYHTTISLGVTKNRNAGDTMMYAVSDGILQSAGIIQPGPILPPSQSIDGGTELYKHTLAFVNGGDVYYGNRGSSFIATLSTNLTVAAATTGYIYGSYIHDVFDTQYGGNTYEARTYNSVIPYSTVVLKDAAPNSVICYKGDTFISMFAYLRSSWPNKAGGAADFSVQEMIYIPCESSINCFYRLDQLQKYYSTTASTYKLQETVTQGLILQPDDYPLELGDLYRYNSVYSKSSNAKLIQNAVFDSNVVERSDVKVIATGKKINNEYSDSWTNLYTNNYIELDPKYGPINNIFSFNNKLFTGQNKAIAVLAVNDRSTIQDNNKIQLTLGTGGVLERYDYITTSSGFQDYYDMAISDKSFYYLDRRNKIIYTLTQNGDTPISEINGYRSFLKSYGTISTTKVAYDPIYKEVFFYISDGTLPTTPATSVLNEYTNSFNGKHTFSPDLMFNLNDQFYSVNDNTVYLHNYDNYGKFYGTTYDSSLTVIINPNGNIVNRFDVLELRVDVTSLPTVYEKEQFTSMVLSNNYQGPATKTITFSGTDLTEDTSKSLVRKWRTTLLPDDMSTAGDGEFFRFVDTYLKVKLIRSNTGNKKLTCHDLTTFFRPVRN